MRGRPGCRPQFSTTTCSLHLARRKCKTLAKWGRHKVAEQHPFEHARLSWSFASRWLRATIESTSASPESGRVLRHRELSRRVIFDRSGQSCLSAHVGFAPKGDLRLGATGRSALRQAERTILQQDFRQCRRVATRHDKLAANYLVFIQPASIRLWLRVSESPRYALDRARVSRAPGRRWRTGASGRRRPRLCRRPFASAAARR